MFVYLQSARSVAGQTCQEAGTTDSSGIDQLQQQSSSSAQSTDRQLTVLLVTVCIVALLLQLPYIVLYNLNRSKYDWLSNDSEALEVLQEATYIALPLSTLNYAINFLLYNFSSSSFRRHVIALVRRQCWRRRLSNHKSRRSSAPTGESYVLMVTRNASCQPTASSAADERDTECKKQSLRESAIADAAAITSA